MAMKSFRTQIPGLRLNIIDRDLLLVLASAADITLAFGTLEVMVVSQP
ncbi:MAG: hypothetical protein ACKO96_14660 [Flammeovirgaceae bacterium]